ncbi:MAG: hypothetical protein R8M38_06695 [Mariprofundaceae bacterium]
MVPQKAMAFYAWQNEGVNLELRGHLRGFSLSLQNPDHPWLYDDKNVDGVAGVNRIMLDAHLGEVVSLELHTVQSYIPLALQSNQGGGGQLSTLTTPEPHDALAWSMDNGRGKLDIDRLNLEISSEHINVKVGRQPINLSSTFFFTPNDFFAPFAAQARFRDYKQGVDALSLDMQIGMDVQLSIIGVRADKKTTQRASYLARGSMFLGHFEYALLVGSIDGDAMVGIDLQGELFAWLGVRAEGHMRFSDDSEAATHEFALNLEHRWQNSLALRVEQFYHGNGATSSKAYLQHILEGASSTYLGKHYSALQVAYTFTPLLSGSLLAIHNWVDHSTLYAVDAAYSFSDEAEGIVSILLPSGDKPENMAFGDEFAAYPRTLSLEYRVYY